MDSLTKLNLDNYKPLGDVVFENLRSAILEGKLKSGQRLMEVQLAEQLGVSRTPVREAIRKLELEGLVVMLPRKGAYVANISVKDLMDVLEIRASLEGLGASLAAERRNDEDIKNLEEVFKRPVFVTDYPKEIKAFYMKLNPDGKTVAAMDCLVPGIGEIIGGSQREDDYEMLKKRMEEVGLDEENYQFYLDLRKYGSTHHSGFGLGFERCVMYLTGISNIRDAIPFPRTVNNCEL